MPVDQLLVSSAAGVAMPIYRVRSGAENVLYLFSAPDDRAAEALARQVADVAGSAMASDRQGCVCVDGLVAETWRRVSAWRDGPGNDPAGG